MGGVEDGGQARPPWERSGHRRRPLYSYKKVGLWPRKKRRWGNLGAGDSNARLKQIKIILLESWRNNRFEKPNTPGMVGQNAL